MAATGEERPLHGDPHGPYARIRKEAYAQRRARRRHSDRLTLTGVGRSVWLTPSPALRRCSLTSLPSTRWSGLRPHLIQARARRVLAAFPGDVLYAVKCNDAPEVLRALWAGGVREFDTASIGEVRAVKALLPRAPLPLHAPGQERRRHRRGLSRPWRAPVRVRPSGRAGQDRGGHRLRRGSRAVRAAGRARRGCAAGADRQVRRRRRGCGRAGARGARLRQAGGPDLPCRLAMRRSRWPMAGRWRSRPRWCARSARSTISTSAAASRRATSATSPSSRRSWRRSARRWRGTG